MAEFRFFGLKSEIDGPVTPAGGGDPVQIRLALDTYGQLVDIPGAIAEALIAAQPPLLILPIAQWDEIGITREQLAEYPSVSSHPDAPEDLRNKFDAVRQAFYNLREQLREKHAAAEASKAEPPAEPDATANAEAKTESPAAPAAAEPHASADEAKPAAAVEGEAAHTGA